MCHHQVVLESVFVLNIDILPCIYSYELRAKLFIANITLCKTDELSDIHLSLRIMLPNRAIEENKFDALSTP